MCSIFYIKQIFIYFQWCIWTNVWVFCFFFRYVNIFILKRRFPTSVRALIRESWLREPEETQTVERSLAATPPCFLTNPTLSEANVFLQTLCELCPTVRGSKKKKNGMRQFCSDLPKFDVVELVTNEGVRAMATSAPLMMPLWLKCRLTSQFNYRRVCSCSKSSNRLRAVLPGWLQNRFLVFNLYGDYKIKQNKKTTAHNH